MATETTKRRKFLILILAIGLIAIVWAGLSCSESPLPAPLTSLAHVEAASQGLQTNYSERGPDFPCPMFAWSCWWLDEPSTQALLLKLRANPEWKELKGKWVGFKHGDDAYVHFVPIKLAQPYKKLPNVAYEVRVSHARTGPFYEACSWFDLTFQPN